MSPPLPDDLSHDPVEASEQSLGIGPGPSPDEHLPQTTVIGKVGVWDRPPYLQTQLEQLLFTYRKDNERLRKKVYQLTQEVARLNLQLGGDSAKT